MAATGTATFYCDLVGTPSGEKIVTTTWSITAGTGQVTTSDVAVGDNTITVPSGTTLIVIVPPTTNTQTLKVSATSTASAFQISTTKPTVLSWQTGASFILALGAGSTLTGLEINFL